MMVINNIYSFPLPISSSDLLAYSLIIDDNLQLIRISPFSLFVVNYRHLFYIVVFNKENIIH